MEKRSRKRVITAAICGIAAFVTMACGIYLTGCKESVEGRKILETPQNLQIKDDYLIWDEVPEAESYVVGINGTEYTTQTNKLDILEMIDKPTDYKMTVCAKGDRERTEDSDWTEKITYTVNEPEHLVYNQRSDGSYEVSAVNDKKTRLQMTGKLIIPRLYKGRNVTAIAENGFRECRNITSVYISDKIEKVGRYAFYACSKLTRVRLSKSQKSIVQNVFQYCTQLKEIDIPKGVLYIVDYAFNECTALEKVFIPDTVTSIFPHAFSDCTALKEVEIPSLVTEICDKAFYGCTTLEKVTFNEGLNNIDSEAFAYCESLSSVRLPASLTSLSITSFSYCDKLTSFTVAEGNTQYKSDSNCITDISGDTLVMGCNGSVIPDYIKTIGDGAFYGCRKIKELIIPNGVEKIGVSNLHNDIMAFQDCGNLESVYIPSTVVEMPETNIFRKCPNLKALTVAEDNPVYKSDGNCIIRKADGVLAMGCTGSVIPDYITTIGKDAFFWCNGLTKVVVPQGVTEIQRDAFKRCHNVREIYLPKSLKKIGANAFSECCYASATIPSSVEETEKNILGRCKAYTTFEIVGSYSNSVLAYDEDNNYPYVYSTVLKPYSLNSGFNDKFGGVLVAPCRQGYTFLGWATEEGSDKVVYKPEVVVIKHKDAPYVGSLGLYYIEETSFNVRITPIDDYSSELYGITLYAVWQKNI